MWKKLHKLDNLCAKQGSWNEFRLAAPVFQFIACKSWWSSFYDSKRRSHTKADRAYTYFIMLLDTCDHYKHRYTSFDKIIMFSTLSNVDSQTRVQTEFPQLVYL